MPSFLGIQKFFGRTVGEAAAFSAGIAVAPALEPVVREIVNEAWSQYQTNPLEPDAWAEIIAEDVAKLPTGETEAKKHGVKPSDFDELVQAVLNAPGIGQLFELWRRKLISDAQFKHGLRKTRLEEQWDTPLEGLHDELLSSAELAMLQQQGFVSEERANSEGELQGVTSERQQLRFEASGLPPGVETALQMLRRRIIDAQTFAQIVREGHTKTKYTDELEQLRDVVLPALNYVEGHLRDWITEAQMIQGGALTGHTPEQMDLLFKIHGRPISFHQTFIGTQRGGTLDGPIGDIDPAFLASLRRSNIQPPFYNLAWAQRYVYPSAFVLRGLTQSGDITQAQAEQVLKFEGWEPTFAQKVAAAWATKKGSAAKEATAADLLTLYEGEQATRAETITALEGLGYPADEAARKLDLVEARRVISAKSAAVSDLHAAFKKGTILGTAAVTSIENLGYSAATAAKMVDAWRALREAEIASGAA